MRLQVDCDYSLRFSDGSTDIVQVVSDDGGGWYTVRTSYGHPDAQESASKRSINISHVVSIEEYYFKRLTRQEISDSIEASKLKSINDRINRLESEISSAESSKSRDIADKSKGWGCILALLVPIIAFIVGLNNKNITADAVCFSGVIGAIGIFVVVRVLFTIAPNEHDRKIESARQEIAELRQKLRR